MSMLDVKAVFSSEKFCSFTSGLVAVCVWCQILAPNKMSAYGDCSSL